MIEINEREAFNVDKIPSGLYDFTVNVLSELDQDIVLPKIDAHDPNEEESSDYLWYEVTPENAKKVATALALQHQRSLG